jgi:hypothetical protein
MSGGMVVVRRDGSLWGVPAETVAAVEKVDDGLAVRLVSGDAVAAEAVVGLAAGARIHSLSTAVRRRLPVGAVGLALWNAEPVVVLGDAGSGSPRRQEAR